MFSVTKTSFGEERSVENITAYTDNTYALLYCCHIYFLNCSDFWTPLHSSSRSFPLHFDETSLFAGDQKEAVKLKVGNT